MANLEYSIRSRLWTVVVLFAGAVVSILGSAALNHFMQPDFPYVAHRAVTTPPSSADWFEIQRKLRYSGFITVYAADPLAGFIVGLLVGLLHKKRAAIIAAGCMVPNFWLEFSSDHIRNWAASASGIAVYLFHGALPLIAAVVGAVLSRLLMGRRQQSSIETRNTSAQHI